MAASTLDGACPSCGHGAGTRGSNAVVVCNGCRLPWPSDNWEGRA